MQNKISEMVGNLTLLFPKKKKKKKRGVQKLNLFNANLSYSAENKYRTTEHTDRRTYGQNSSKLMPSTSIGRGIKMAS